MPIGLGRLPRHDYAPSMIPSRQTVYGIHKITDDAIWLVDRSSEPQFAKSGACSITNAAESVVEEVVLNFSADNKRIFYFDTEGREDELIHNGRYFVGFGLLPNALPTPQQEKRGMNYSTAVFLINDKVRAMRVAVSTASGNRDAGPQFILKTLDQSMKVDDYVVIPTGSAEHLMTVGRIIETDIEVDFDSTLPMAWIVSIVDMSDYKHTIEIEGQAIKTVKSAERKKKRDELATAMFADHAEKLKTLEIAHSDEMPARASTATGTYDPTGFVRAPPPQHAPPEPLSDDDPAF